MAKCGICGKFLPARANHDSVKCTKCPAVFHRACVPTLYTTTGNDWVCSVCKPVEVTWRDDSFSTPKAQGSKNHMENNSSVDSSRSNSMSLSFVQELRALRQELTSMRAEVRQYREEIVDFKATLN